MKPILKEDFDKLFDENISKKEYDCIIGLVNNRVNHILLYCILKVLKINWHAYSYSNDIYFYNGAGGGSDGGFFDPLAYRDFIELYIDSKSGLTIYRDGFPTEFLFLDDEEIKRRVLKEYEEKKQDEIREKEMKKQKRIAEKAKKAEMKSIIQSKLTKEELKFIRFK